MVKGVSRRVIVVNTPDPRLFEQAIFIVKEDAFHKSGVSADDVIQEARRVADGYVMRNSFLGKRLRRAPPVWQCAAFAAGGAALATVVWSLAIFF